MRDLSFHDILLRSAKTFVQTFMGVLAVTYVQIVDWDTAKAVLISAVAAGFSAVWNALLTMNEIRKM